MEVTFRFEAGATNQAIASTLVKAALGLTGNESTPVGAAGEPPVTAPVVSPSVDDDDLSDDLGEEVVPAKRGRPKKKPEVEEVGSDDLDDLDSSEDAKGSDDDAELDDLDDEEEKPAPKAKEKTDKKAAAKYERKDINKAVLAFAGKHGKPAARKLLAKYKAENISEVKETDFAALIADAKK